MAKFIHKKYISGALISVFFFAFIVLGPQYDSKVGAVDQQTYKNLKLFTEALDIVERNYVEKVDPDTLMQGAINGMVKSLDPHSAYLSPEMYKELQSDTKGYFGGIGIEITMQNDIPTVVSPIEDTPAFLAGIKAGDQIIRIDQKSTKGITIMEAVKRLRGPENTKVKLTIMRKDVPQPLIFTITRAVINVKSVKYRIFEGNIGYIRIASFQERTTDDVKKALADFGKKTSALQGIVIDMRNNPGGLLDQAVRVSDLFLKSGTIVSIMGRVKTLDSRFTATNDHNEPTCPIIVLVNEGSASAAEIVAGALQDNGRAIVLGTQTFGKGSVQTVIPFENGSALKLTTAKYYTPKGKSIQAEGIKPDIVVEYVKHVEKDQEITIREKDLVGHIKSEDEKGAKTQEKAGKDFDDLNKDNQLKTAVDLLKSWEIFKKKQVS
ncbi:MAG: S41 family peptidase [Syntrophales bacterium]